MADLDALARRAVAAVMDLARRGISLAIGLALITAIISLAAFALGLAALEGSTRRAWTVIGGTMLVIAVGAPLLAGWRLWQIRRSADSLVADVRKLLTNNAEAERVVIETIEVEEATGAASPAVVGQSAQFTRLRRVALSTADLRTLPAALRAVTLFPALLAIAILFSLVFAVLGFLFLVAWAL